MNRALFGLLAACGQAHAPAVDVSATHVASPPTEDSPPVEQVACGDFHSCARMSDGTVRCWGRDKSGELGDGGGQDRTRPVTVPGVSGVVEVALGANFSCARLGDGTVTCWGSGRILGDGVLVDRVKPTRVASVANAVELRSGGYMTCARDADGAVSCWGLETAAATKPTGMKNVAVAAAHACGRTADDAIRCWGEGMWDPRASPSFASPAVKGALQVDTGDTFGCAIVAGGSVTCWGQNEQSELGIEPDEDDHVEAALVPSVLGVRTLASSESHSCALLEAGTVTCWGSNTEGELGRGTQSTGETPAPIRSLSRVVEVDTGADHACARTTSRTYCWGANRSGQLGDGTTESRRTPVEVRY